MKKQHSISRSATAFLVALLLAWPAINPPKLAASPRRTIPTTATTASGDATAVQATVLGALGGLSSTTTTLASTGSLAGTSDARDASSLTGGVPALLTGETLSAATIGYPDQVDSMASIANLNLSLSGVGISADTVVAQASQVLGAAGCGSSSFGNLNINGVPINVTGIPNQIVAIPGGQVVINQQSVSSDGTMVVNALHVIVNGVADVVVASATAGIR